MGSKIRGALVCLLSLAFITGIVWAQSVPQLINYQGRLTDSSGQPLADGTTVDMTFNFYGVESGSTSLYLTVLQEDVVINKGIYNVLIGSGTIIPGTESSLSSAFQKHQNIWMGIKVDSDPEMSPRSRMTNVPFAEKANTVNTSWLDAYMASSDYDGDGYTKLQDGGTDCDDNNSAVNPGVAEVCDDGFDNDCNGYVDKDDLPCIFWLWISGSTVINQNGVYGTKGVPDSANVPGSRYRSVSWIDDSGNMWIFGGRGYPGSGYPGYLNDLWRWDGAEWTWISGSDVRNQNGVYGTKGTPESGNVPGAREEAVSWIDGSGNMWLFGGYGYDENGLGYLNDLWRWDGTYWTWMSGDTVINQYGVYGTKGVPDSANVPGAREEAVSWIDSSGNLWLFGGSGYPESGSLGYLNDLWRFE